MARGRCITCQPCDGAGQNAERDEKRAAGEHGASVHEVAAEPKEVRIVGLELHQPTTRGKHDRADVHAMHNGSIHDRGNDIRRVEQHDIDVFARIDTLLGDSASARGHEKVRARRETVRFDMRREQVLPVFRDEPCFFLELPASSLLGRFTRIDHARRKLATHSACAVTILIHENELPHFCNCNDG